MWDRSSYAKSKITYHPWLDEAPLPPVIKGRKPPRSSSSTPGAEKDKLHITESMSDRAWNDAEEYDYVFDFDLGDEDEACIEKNEAQVQKRRSKKLCERSSDNTQWEDQQLLRSGAARGTDVQIESYDDEERKVTLLVHELAGSKLGNILGVEKSAEQVIFLITREVDFKGDATFARHMKKGEAVSDFAKSKSISEQRQYLPVFSVRDEFLQVVRENQVVVVVGETGSGKTTQLTQYLHEDGYTTNGIVGCTQPRRVAAMSVTKRVSEEMETELGDLVGYAIRFEDITGANTCHCNGRTQMYYSGSLRRAKMACRGGKENAYREEMLPLPQPVPEIQRSNIGNVLLLLKSLKVDNLLDFEFMDPPPRENILNSMYQLWVLGALSNTGSLTRIGCKMIEFPLDPGLAKLLITGEEFSCVNEVLTIVSMLSVPSVFFRPRDRAEESAAAHEKFFVPESDHLTLLNIYRQWEANEYCGDWCSKHFLQVKSLRNARKVRSQLLEILKRLKIPLTSCGSKWNVIRKAICSSYFHNAARLKGGIGEYVNCRNGMPCHLHPSSAIYGMGYTPDYVVYHELTLTTKEYMQCATSVERKHKKRHRDEKSAMEEEMVNLRKQQEQVDIRVQRRGEEEREEGETTRSDLHARIETS
ncbi:pre-mRNA-splicing factor ATP-dependent RNA helicase DEAH7-like protein [Tanacetum coccineum]